MAVRILDRKYLLTLLLQVSQSLRVQGTVQVVVGLRKQQQARMASFYHHASRRRLVFQEDAKQTYVTLRTNTVCPPIQDCDGTLIGPTTTHRSGAGSYQ